MMSDRIVARGTYDTPWRVVDAVRAWLFCTRLFRAINVNYAGKKPGLRSRTRRHFADPCQL